MQLEARTLVARGALAGAAGGVAAALFQWLVTGGPLGDALAIEEANRGGGDGGEMFSRTTQVLGGMLGAALYGLFLGVVFGVVLARLWHRLPGRDDFGRAARMAGAGFVALALVPALKYPANPPAVGDPETVDGRTANFLTLLIASVVVLHLAWWGWNWLTARGIEGARRFATVAALYGVTIGLVFLLWPANDDAIELPATLIWRFRVDSLAQHGLMWAVMAVAFGLLAEAGARAPARQGAAAERDDTPA